MAPGIWGPQRVQAREAISQSAPLLAEFGPVQMQMKPLPWMPESQSLLKEQHQGNRSFRVKQMLTECPLGARSRVRQHPFPPGTQDL